MTQWACHTEGCTTPTNRPPHRASLSGLPSFRPSNPTAQQGSCRYTDGIDQDGLAFLKYNYGSEGNRGVVLDQGMTGLFAPSSDVCSFAVARTCKDRRSSVRVQRSIVGCWRVVAALGEPSIPLPLAQYSDRGVWRSRPPSKRNRRGEPCRLTPASREDVIRVIHRPRP